MADVTTAEPSLAAMCVPRSFKPSSLRGVVISALGRWPRRSGSFAAARGMALLLSLDCAGAADFPLQQQDAIQQCLCRRRAAGHVDVDGYDAVATAHDGI